VPPLISDEIHLGRRLCGRLVLSLQPSLIITQSKQATAAFTAAALACEHVLNAEQDGRKASIEAGDFVSL
jgi:hypothetical protein